MKENELTGEMKQIEELVKRIETLEERIAKLEEKTAAANAIATSATTNVKDYQKDEFTINLTSYVRDDDGSITKFWKSAKKVNYDTRCDSCHDTLSISANGRVSEDGETAGLIGSFGRNDKEYLLLSEMAEEKGHRFSFDLPDSLPDDGDAQYTLLKKMIEELVKTYGKGGRAYFDNYMIKIDSKYIYKLGFGVMDDTVKFLSNPAIIKREWDNEPFVDNLDWTEAERYHAIKKYVLSLKMRFA